MLRGIREVGWPRAWGWQGQGRAEQTECFEKELEEGERQVGRDERGPPTPNPKVPTEGGGGGAEVAKESRHKPDKSTGQGQLCGQNIGGAGGGGAEVLGAGMADPLKKTGERN